MQKFKKSAYTLILIATCFVASPLIFHKIWKSSSDAKPVDNSSIADESQPQQEVTTEITTGIDDTPQIPEEPELPEVPFVTSDISYFDDALFIGDSRTVGIKEYGTFRNSDYFCSVGMSAYKIDEEEIDNMTFDEVLDKKQYGKVYIMLGINEVGNDPEVTLTSYRAIVDKIKAHQPNALIYIQGNLHVSYSAETDVINNNSLNYLNNMLASLADNEKVFYIDINEVYDDANGYLTESYTSDGIHPFGMYYRKWCEWLCTKTIAVEELPATEPPTTQLDIDEESTKGMGEITEEITTTE